MTSRAFHVVEMFEEAMAEYAGSKYGVAVDSCTTALFLCFIYEADPNDPMTPEGQGTLTIPSRTYISVAHSIKRAGYGLAFDGRVWSGAYRIGGMMTVVDSALRMRRGMFGKDDPEIVPETYRCVSFHMRKHIKIGRGGMILTDDADFVEWAQEMRFDGRHGSVSFLADSDISLPGFNAYMLPEQAARGLQLLEALPDDNPDLTPAYPDLSLLPVFRQ